MGRAAAGIEMRTILVIDDNPVVLEMTRLTLELAGFRVLTRESALGVIGAILQERPDMVLLDVNMPNLSADALAEVVFRTRSARGTVMVLHSSLPPNTLRMKALAAGAHGSIPKTRVQVDLICQVRAFLPSDSMAAPRTAPAIPEVNGASQPRLRAALPIRGVPPEPTAFGFAGVSSAPPEPARARASAPPGIDDSGSLQLSLPTALFLDQDLAVLTAYRRALSSDEVRGEYATSGEQALRRISTGEPPDVVVTDLMLPGMTGMDLYRRALELNPRWRHRFVFVTGAGSLPHVAEFLRRSGGRALDKPVDLPRLRDAIRYAATGARILRKHTAKP